MTTTRVEREAGRSRCRGLGVWPVAVLAGLATSLVAGRAAPQLLDDYALGSGITPVEVRVSARLQAMGFMREAVADENNEIDLLDFAGNLTGHLTDKAGDHIEVFSGPRTWKDRTTRGLGDEDYKSFPTRFELNLMPGAGSALGGGVALVEATSDRLVTRRLREVFTLPIEDGVAAPTSNAVVDAALRAPVFDAHYAAEVNDRLAVGLGWLFVHQREEKRTQTLYRVEHSSDAHHLLASLAVDVVPPGSPAGFLRSLVVGASGQVGEANIDGAAAGALHNDTYDWERPAVAASVHAIGDLGEGMKAGLDFRYSSFEGQETASYNWSDEFFLNPLADTIVFSRQTFVEGFRSREMRARWAWRLPRQPVRLAAAFSASQEEYWQLPSANVNAFVAPKNLQETSWQAVGGGTYYLPDGRGLVAAEAAWGFSDVDDRISRPITRVGSSVAEIGAGGEYFPWLHIGFRGGYRRILFDANRDVDDAAFEETTDRVAVGFGYRTSDAAWQIDGGYTFDFIRRDTADPEVEDQDRGAFTLQLRWLL